MLVIAGRKWERSFLALFLLLDLSAKNLQKSLICDVVAGKGA
jgi:hypothetical protein